MKDMNRFKKLSGIETAATDTLLEYSEINPNRDPSYDIEYFQDLLSNLNRMILRNARFAKFASEDRKTLVEVIDNNLCAVRDEVFAEIKRIEAEVKSASTEK